jgi:Ca2+-binding RTX toxin-like protein
MRMRNAGRVAVLAALGVAPVLVLAAPAHAATGVTRVGAQITANAANNRANNITISTLGNNVILRDLGDTMTAGAGCFQLAANAVRCPSAGVLRVAVNTGNLNDRVNNLTAIAGVFNGGAGNDTLLGGSRNDRLRGGLGNDTMVGNAGNDTAIYETGRDGRDTFNGGAGRDTADYRLRTIAVNVSLNGVANDGSAPEFDNNLANVENATGGRAGDRLTGNAVSNVLDGQAGADTLSGLNGNDRLISGFGNDTLLGGNGNDTAVALGLRDGRDVFNGGAGTDTTDYSARNIAVNVTLNGVANDGSAPEFDNNLANVENATGGRAGDRLTGNGAGNVLRGNAANDVLSGGGARDTLIGGAGNDQMFGQAGNDLIQAVDGVRDIANGGANTDDCNTDAIDVRVSCEL